MSDYRITSLCRADRDGDCYWKPCPQLRDREPHATGRHCPLDRLSPENCSLDEAETQARIILRDEGFRVCREDDGDGYLNSRMRSK